MKVYFEDRYGNYREIADVQNKQEVNKAISDFLERHNYKSYYTRNWVGEGKLSFDVIYDVGSHSEFFHVPFDDKNEADAFLRNKDV